MEVARDHHAEEISQFQKINIVCLLSETVGKYMTNKQGMIWNIRRERWRGGEKGFKGREYN